MRVHGNWCMLIQARTMIRSVAFISLTSLIASIHAQQPGTLFGEYHPPLPWQRCIAGGSCQTVSGSITLDERWRSMHKKGSLDGCWDSQSGWIDPPCGHTGVCAQSCEIEGADYAIYGVTTSGNALQMIFVNQGPYGTSVGSRVFLMENDTLYQTFKLKNREFTFDVDVSRLPCGVKSSLYFVGMDADGGKQQYLNNKAGAKYGTGYCDARCTRSVRFINGEANIPYDVLSGKGYHGSCCLEIDLWEANSISTALTYHTCAPPEPYECGDDECTNVVCDGDGCDINPYRNGATTFYGNGRTVNTANKITVVTRFLTADGSDYGLLNEIQRVYIQNGQVIQNAQVNFGGSLYNSITENYCSAQKSAFGEPDFFSSYGGFWQDHALDRGLVLAMGIEGDHVSNMQWLDGKWGGGPGYVRGTCPSSLDWEEVEMTEPHSRVTFSNIKFGPIGSTA
ncbi:hypothetical protein FRC02_002560 [Tulasnella sp. 418]|nr:hypothetical protein FRC02_002560 [Tulasnella sp. 418]